MKNKTTNTFWGVGITVILALCLLPLAGTAQAKHKGAVYHVWLQNQQKPSVTRGYLRHLSDSTLTMSKSPSRNTASWQEYSVEQVEWVKFRKQGNISKGILLGSVAGFVSGFLLGILDGSDPPCTGFCLRYDAHEKGMIYGLITVPVGMIIGGTIGSIRTHITIGGSRSEYARQREQLERYRLGQ